MKIRIRQKYKFEPILAELSLFLRPPDITQGLGQKIGRFRDYSCIESLWKLSSHNNNMSKRNLFHSSRPQWPVNRIRRISCKTFCKHHWCETNPLAYKSAYGRDSWSCDGGEGQQSARCGGPRQRCPRLRQPAPQSPSGSGSWQTHSCGAASSSQTGSSCRHVN